MKKSKELGSSPYGKLSCITNEKVSPPFCGEGSGLIFAKKGQQNRLCLVDKVIIAILYRFEMEFINNSSSNLQFVITPDESNIKSLIFYFVKSPPPFLDFF